jgi:hypothetical protein
LVIPVVVWYFMVSMVFISMEPRFDSYGPHVNWLGGPLLVSTGIAMVALGFTAAGIHRRSGRLEGIGWAILALTLTLMFVAVWSLFG